MNEQDNVLIKSELKEIESNIIKQIYAMKRDIISKNDDNTNIILSTPTKDNEVYKVVAIKSTTKGVQGITPLTEKEKQVGDIFEDTGGDKVQLETDTMILTVPQQTPLEYIVGQEANIVEFVSNYMSYLLPIIYNHYHDTTYSDKDCQSVIKPVIKEG